MDTVRADFQQRVIDSLARLETQMENLVGNGQPGRVGKLETSVESLEKSKYWFAGAMAGVSTALSTIIHFVFNK